MLGYLTRATLLNEVSVSLLTSAESGALPLSLIGRIESIVLRAASVSGTADVNLQYSTSPDGTNFDSYADNFDITPSTLLAKPNNAEGFNAYPPPSPINEHVKFKVTGVLLNPADTLVTAYAILKEGDE